MGSSSTLTGMTDNGSANTNVVRGNVDIISGTWTGGGSTDVSITTGLAKILAFGATGNSCGAAPKIVVPNSGSDGVLKITFNAAGDTGNWWAIGSST